MNNKLETSLSQNDLNCLFSTKVEKASNHYFYIITNTHKIYIKNPQITWEQPLAVIVLLSLFIIVTGFGIDENTHLEIGNNEIEMRPWRFLWFIPLLGILFVFAKTSGDSFSSFDEIAKTSKKKWHTIYTNNINADVTVSTEHVTLNPKKSVTRDDKEKLFTAGTYIPLHLSSKTVTITATNKHDSTSKEAELTDDNFIEK